METKIINLFGPSGCGKSSGAAYIFSKLKMIGISCELVPEYAKDKVWEGNKEIFLPENQVYIFGKQYYRISRLIGKVDYVITDSPILLSNVYNKSDVLKKHFCDAVRDCHKNFNNISQKLYHLIIKINIKFDIIIAMIISKYKSQVLKIFIFKQLRNKKTSLLGYLSEPSWIFICY